MKHVRAVDHLGIRRIDLDRRDLCAGEVGFDPLHLTPSGADAGKRTDSEMSDSAEVNPVEHRKDGVLVGDMKYPYRAEVLWLHEPQSFPSSPVPAGAPLTLAQSGAIELYIAEKSGKFLAQDPVRRALTLQWLMFAVTDCAPASMARSAARTASAASRSAWRLAAGTPPSAERRPVSCMQVLTHCASACSRAPGHATASPCGSTGGAAS